MKWMLILFSPWLLKSTVSMGAKTRAVATGPIRLVKPLIYIC